MTQQTLWAEPVTATPSTPSTDVAPWLVDHIRTTTGADPGARWAWHGRCPRCRARILRGLNDTQLAWTVHVDPVPLGSLGEALALLAGRDTVWLRRETTSTGTRRYALTRRDRWHIDTAAVTGPWRWADVLAEHRCGAPVLPSVPSRIRAQPRPPDPDSAPPF